MLEGVLPDRSSHVMSCGSKTWRSFIAPAEHTENHTLPNTRRITHLIRPPSTPPSLPVCDRSVPPPTAHSVPTIADPLPTSSAPVCIPYCLTRTAAMIYLPHLPLSAPDLVYPHSRALVYPHSRARLSSLSLPPSPPSSLMLTEIAHTVHRPSEHIQPALERSPARKAPRRRETAARKACQRTPRPVRGLERKEIVEHSAVSYPPKHVHPVSNCFHHHAVARSRRGPADGAAEVGPR